MQLGEFTRRSHGAAVGIQAVCGEHKFAVSLRKRLGYHPLRPNEQVASGLSTERNRMDAADDRKTGGPVAPSVGGQGSGASGLLLADPGHIRADARMLRRAIRNKWPITKLVKQETVETLRDIMKDPMEKSNNRIAAAKTLVAADSVNARREQSSETGDQHVHFHSHEADRVLNDPDYIAWQRERALLADSDARPLRTGGEQGQMEVSPAPRLPG